jgi:hypothetical protein
MIGDRSVALITATLSGTSFLAPDYKSTNKTSYNTEIYVLLGYYAHLISIAAEAS